jgi:hypothetical protein
MRLKSISSFIASVLLISFTIASGIIIYYFVTTLPKVQTKEVSSQASKVLSCAGAVYDVKVRNCNLLNGLVLWLRMDEGSGNITYDYSGYGNNGTLYNGSTICGGIDACPLWVDGKFGKAISFDGVDDYVRVPQYSQFFTLPLTISVWFKIDSWVRQSTVVTTRLHAHWGNWWLLLTNQPYIWAQFRGINGVDYRVQTAVTLGSWVNIVFGHDGSNVFLYKDGVLVEKTNMPVAVDWQPRDLDIGARVGIYHFNGTIDEVRIYNRVLSEEEIKELYYNGLTNKFNITIGLLNFGYADLGNSFNAIVYLKNGTILQLPLILNRDLIKGSYLENNLTIDGYYPSYGLVDKIMVCSNDCQGVCYEVNVNNQC